MTPLKLAASVCLTVSLIAMSASAQPWPTFDSAPAVDRTGSADAALIVSIEDYAFLPDIEQANRNAADWERFLSDGMGIPTVLTLTDSQAVREQILLSAERAASEVKEGGTLWFVFIGHGAPTEDGEGVLIGADGQQNVISIAARGINQTELVERFRNGAQSRTVMLIDACFSGRDRSGEALAVGTMPVVAVKAPSEAGDDLLVMTAARSDEVAGNLPELGRPAFSYLMLGALRGWADGGDGEVTAEEAVRFARRELVAIPGRRQTPQLDGSGGMVLSAGVSERRPGRPETTATATSDADVGQTGSLLRPRRVADGVPDWPVWLSLHIAFGTRSGPGMQKLEEPTIGETWAPGPVGLATAGVKLNYFSKKPREWRLGARVNVFGSPNPDPPKRGVTFLENTRTDGRSLLEEDGKIQREYHPVLFMGPQFGHAWRTEKSDADDTVLELDVFGGVAPKFGVCTSWKYDTIGNVAECHEDHTELAFGGGLGFQAQWGVLELSVQAAYLANLGLVSFAGLGISLDP